MTSSGRYAYAREILSKKATKIVFTIKRLLSNIDSSAVETRNKLFDALVKPVPLYGCEIWQTAKTLTPQFTDFFTDFDKKKTTVLQSRNGDQNYYLIRHILINFTNEQVHIKFCQQTLNVPRYTENKACRAEQKYTNKEIKLKRLSFRRIPKDSQKSSLQDQYD